MTDISSESINKQLSRILASPKFTASKRLSRFLSFVVKQSQKGQSGRIKQYTIAVDALGYGNDFDPQSDPTVRIQARRLRRALDRYYETLGTSDPIRIDIPKGAYVPIFVEIGSTPARIKRQNTGKQPASTVCTDETSRLISPASIAVLPFAYRGVDKKEAYLAHALTEAISVGLTKFESLNVIASQPVIQFKGVPDTVDEIGKVLDARFILTGSVLKKGDAIRVAVKLTDSINGALVWAESMDRDTSSLGIFASLDDITRRILINVGDEHGLILHHLIQEIYDKPLHELSVYETSLLYHYYNTTAGPDEHDHTRLALERSVEIDPTYALGWAQLAVVYGDMHALGYHGLKNPLEKALYCSKKAIALNPRSQESRLNMAFVRFLLEQHKAAITEAKEAISLNPNSAYAVSFSGWLIGLSGELEQGRRIIDEMDNYKPNLPGWLRLVAFFYHLEKGEFEQALHEARRFRMPDEIPWDPICRATAAAYLGETKVAGVAYRELVNKFPGVAKNAEKTIRVYCHFEHLTTAILEGLKKAETACGKL